MNSRRVKDKAEILVMLNTVLFGVGAGLVSLAWMRVILRDGKNNGVMGALFNLNEPLLLISVAILLGGVFHSFTILYPTFLKATLPSRKKLSHQLLFHLFKELKILLKKNTLVKTLCQTFLSMVLLFNIVQWILLVGEVVEVVDVGRAVELVVELVEEIGEDDSLVKFDV